MASSSSPNKNVKRKKSAEEGDKYLSPPLLVDVLEKVVDKFVKNDDLLWDPASHDGRLLKPFRERRFAVKNSDIQPFEDSVEKVEKINFLLNNVKRPLNVPGLIIVMNPPYKLPSEIDGVLFNTKTSGVGHFLDKSSELLNEGEYAITVCQPMQSTYTNLKKVANDPKCPEIKPNLILREEYNFTNRVEFTDYNKNPENPPKAPQHTTIQVWQKGSPEIISPTSKIVTELSKEEKKRFTTTLNKKSTYDGENVIFKGNYGAGPILTRNNPICYVLRSNTGKNCGRVETSVGITGKQERNAWKPDLEMESETVNTTYSPEGGASALVGVYVNDESKTSEVMAKLHYLFAAGYYQPYLGEYLFQGKQTVNITYIRYLYHNFDAVVKGNFIPERGRDLGIKTYWVKNGEGPSVKETEEYKDRVREIRKLDPYETVELIRRKITGEVKKSAEVKPEEEDVVFIKTESAGSSNSKVKREGDDGKVSKARKKRGKGTENDPYIVELMKKWGVVSYKDKLKF
jgi:hypothetical protein